jgi:uncharacterized protein YabE (DUF348 family)
MPRTRVNLSIFILGSIIVCLLFAIFIKKQSIFASESATPSSETVQGGTGHYITIYDENGSLTIRSDAKTVADVLERTDIKIGDNDIVEPGLDEEIKEEDFNINIYRAREALVIDGYSRKYIKTASTAPEEVAKDAGVELLEADVVKIVPQNNLLESGMNVAYEVVRAKIVNLNFYGKPTQIRTQAKTVKQFLKEQEISTNRDENWVSVPLNTAITDGFAFTVYRQGKQTITVEEDIMFGEAVTYDYSIDYGKRIITKAGKIGKRVSTYEVDMKDGQELSRTFISNVVTQNPETQRVTVGMKINLPPGTHQDWMAQAGISSADFGYVNFIIEHESHWNPLSRNVRSGATGLCQALPGSKMASAGSDWETNPITQLRWCNGYAVGRYGGWRQAYEFWTQHKWW